MKHPGKVSLVSIDGTVQFFVLNSAWRRAFLGLAAGWRKTFHFLVAFVFSSYPLLHQFFLGDGRSWSK